MDQFSTVVVIAFAVFGVLFVALTVTRRRRRKRPSIDSYIFNEDGSIKWPQQPPDYEVLPNLEERISHLEKNGFQNPETEVMTTEVGTESRSAKWTDGGPGYRGEPVSRRAVWKDPEPEPEGPDFKMHKLQCDNCGGKLIVTSGSSLVECESCGVQYYLENFELGAWPPYKSHPYFLKGGWETPDYG